MQLTATIEWDIGGTWEPSTLNILEPVTLINWQEKEIARRFDNCDSPSKLTIISPGWNMRPSMICTKCHESFKMMCFPLAQRLQHWNFRFCHVVGEAILLTIERNGTLQFLDGHTVLVLNVTPACIVSCTRLLLKNSSFFISALML